MKNAFIRFVAVGIVLIFNAQGAGNQSAAAANGYKLLRLGGTWVKWGEPALGTRAQVTYAFATTRYDTPEARNCRSIIPSTQLLQRLRITSSSFRNEAKAAFAAWSEVADISFSAVDDPAAADIVIGVQRAPRGRAYTNVSYWPASIDSTRKIRKSLICLNPAIRWKIGFDGNLDTYDLRYTLIHEIGHAIGLDHPGPEGQIMSFNYHEDFRDLRPGDVNGASILYGGPAVDADGTVQQASGQGVNRADGAATDTSIPQLSLGEKQQER